MNSEKTEESLYYIISDDIRSKYGIKTSSGEETPLIINSINDAESLISLIRKLNDLSPLHITDVARDFVLEKFYERIG